MDKLENYPHFITESANLPEVKEKVAKFVRMEDIQDTFTRRILRRASQRRERDRKEAINRSAEISLRRSNILRATNVPSMSLLSYSMDIDDRETLDRSYGSFRDSFNVTGYSCNDDNNNNEKSFDGNAKKSPASQREEMAILVKVTERNIEVPAKMIAELKKIDVNETSNDSFDFTRDKRSSISGLEAMTKTPERRSLNALSTEAVVEMCNRVSSVLTDIRHDPVESGDFKNTDFDDINSRSSNFVENQPEESTGENDNYSRNKEMSISPETPIGRSVNTELTTEAVVAMCKRVSLVLTDIRCDSTDPRNVRNTDFPRIVEETNFRSQDFVERQPEESTGRDADFSTNKSSESWDEDKFLEVALGEDRYESLTEEDATRPDCPAIEPIADRSPLRKRVTEALNLPAQKTPPNRNSSTLDRSMRIYRTLSHRIKKKFQPIFRADRKEETPEEPTTIPPRIDDSERIRELLREVKIQQTIINQSTKALDLCTSLKQFTESAERVESERSLLLASLRGEAALDEIKSITSDEKREEKFSEKGEVTISEMSLDLRARLDSEREETEWFLVVVSHGLRVWATRAVNCSPEETRVNFPGSVSMADLTPAFKILVQVYSLKLGRDAYSDEDKYRTKKCSRNNFWPSSSSIFRKVDISSPQSVRNGALRTAETSFVLSGFTELVLEDLSVTSPWPLMMVPVDSRLRGSIDLDIACRLRFSIGHEGFLNHGDEAGGLANWNRRWCVLRGHTLKFWNYPREEETKEPLKIVELVDCVSDEVTTVDRKMCAKPRTLLIETKRSRLPGDRNSIVIECKPACTIVRNLLSFDSARELGEWSAKINEVIVALEEWNVIGRRSRPSVI